MKYHYILPRKSIFIEKKCFRLFLRQGIGSQAFRYMLSACPDWKHITVATPSDKEKNLKFYTEKCGFSIAGKEMDGTVEVAKFVMERNVPH